IDRKIMQLEIEREAIKRENDEAKLERLNEEIANLQEEQKSLQAKWQQEKDIVEQIQKSKTEMEELKFQAEQAERNGDYGKVAEIRYGKMKEQEQLIEDSQQKLIDLQSSGLALIKEEVDSEDIAEIIAKWT